MIDKIMGIPIEWAYEEELPVDYPYELMLPHSKVVSVRMFPVSGRIEEAKSTSQSDYDGRIRSEQK